MLDFYSTWIYYILAVWILYLSDNDHGVIAGRLECCRHIPNKGRYTACKDSCDQAWMSSGPLQQIEIFSSTYRYCPVDNLLNFWQCVGTNYPVLTDIEIWEGRACCELAYSTDCKLACHSATHLSDLEGSCSTEDETLLYTCARKQKGSTACCSNIYSTQCKAACRAMFTTDNPSNPTLLDNLSEMCTNADSYVHHCVSNRTHQHEQTTPATAKGLKCCDQGSSSVCKQTCIQALTSLTNQSDIIQTLVPVCGTPASTDPLWQCFLLSESGPPPPPPRSEDSSPMDGASIRCCSRAITSQCKSLCIQLYNQRLSSVWESFSSACQYNTQESAMMECIQEVEEPCKLGCEGLTFCSNYNNRVNDMFRTCDSKADYAAKVEYTAWLNKRYIELPSTLRVPIKDIRNCQPDMWKAISCALNIKPCNSNSSSNMICKSDCTHILRHCVDDSSMTYNIGALCDQLPVSDNEKECISLSQFIEPVDRPSSIDLSNPCVPHPCNNSEVCEVNRNYPACTNRHRSCQPYICRAGCPVGGTSPLIVRKNYFVRLADISSASPLSCQKICKCGHNGFLTHCQSTYCDRSDSCIPNSDSIVEHGAVYQQDCSECICNSGETVCNRKSCPPTSQLASQLPSYTHEQTTSWLPCRCPSTYQPVCTINGRVLSNPCLAKCIGYTEANFVVGNCASRNPCGGNSCPTGSKCIPERKTCLSVSTQCPQYICVPAACNTEEHGVVCDSTGLEHPNICTLLGRRRQLGYSGHCMHHCTHNSPVCGVDGETYMNECSAFANSVLVDYNSPCKATPDRTDTDSACSRVRCDRKPPLWCDTFIPPGACCPVCGSQIQALYSQIYVDKIVTYSDVPYLTTKSLSTHLQHHLSNRRCDVYTYISYEQELIIIILPLSRAPTQVEVEFCNTDAKRISNMIDTNSPLVSVDVELSILLRSRLYSSKLNPIPSITSAAAVLEYNKINLVLLTLILTAVCAVT